VRLVRAFALKTHESWLGQITLTSFERARASLSPPVGERGREQVSPSARKPSGVDQRPTGFVNPLTERSCPQLLTSVEGPGHLHRRVR